ncbi:helix-turn-helix transcriptional regulator [Candidatus Saccharibacteria bacterium]|nr:helix-turn-helix transcriptional regulator [Candidatus Saccharibacteria bacterium]
MNSKHTEILQNNVVKLRQNSGQTQAELALSAGVTRQTIIAIEKGDYVPSVLLAMKLAKHFKTTIEKVFYV